MANMGPGIMTPDKEITITLSRIGIMKDSFQAIAYVVIVTYLFLGYMELSE